MKNLSKHHWSLDILPWQNQVSKKGTEKVTKMLKEKLSNAITKHKDKEA